MPRLFYFSLVAPLKPAIKIRNRHPDEFELNRVEGECLVYPPCVIRSPLFELDGMPSTRSGRTNSWFSLSRTKNQPSRTTSDAAKPGKTRFVVEWTSSRLHRSYLETAHEEACANKPSRYLTNLRTSDR
jgi:hypothetical protein